MKSTVETTDLDASANRPLDWRTVTFGETFDFLTTANSPWSELGDGEICYIHYGDIHTKWRTRLDLGAIDLPKINADSVQGIPRLKDGDLVMVDASEDTEALGVGAEITAAGSIPTVAGLHTFLLRAKNNSLAPGFAGLLQYMRETRSGITAAATGVSVYSISKKSLAKVSFPLPPVHEQAAIVLAVTDSDALIESLDGLLEKKRAIRLATMQALLTGKRKLPGFNNSWKNYTLGQLVDEFVGGSTPSRLFPRFFTGNIPWVTISDLNFGQVTNTTEHLTEEGVHEANLHLLPVATFVMSIIGQEAETTRGRCALLGVPSTISQSCLAVRPSKSIDTAYLLYWYSLFGSKLAQKYCQGTKQQNFNADVVGSLPIFLPGDVEEQKQIALVLTDLDADIAALEQYRRKAIGVADGIKQALLSGKVRLLEPLVGATT